MANGSLCASESSGSEEQQDSAGGGAVAAVMSRLNATAVARCCVHSAAAADCFRPLQSRPASVLAHLACSSCLLFPLVEWTDRRGARLARPGRLRLGLAQRQTSRDGDSSTTELQRSAASRRDTALPPHHCCKTAAALRLPLRLDHCDCDWLTATAFVWSEKKETAQSVSQSADRSVLLTRRKGDEPTRWCQCLRCVLQ